VNERAVKERGFDGPDQRGAVGSRKKTREQFGKPAVMEEYRYEGQGRLPAPTNQIDGMETPPLETSDAWRLVEARRNFLSLSDRYS
jgi:hypothetical protein